ncbi:class I SAM-dependent methyltransferase [Jiangella ureilytica]|uniref:Class I SAM-dependent methyltransferase n=1 Tax=Jiangella ureilytica TaxID=2530374 RepID=A0A4R4RW81_9ACTN|nr:class I SAM-dependent methyltransferase [Jiangella ureilytica]TDC54428.1 class I SAM-dependent methyltransferase [Jiangella ureilytica]
MDEVVLGMTARQLAVGLAAAALGLATAVLGVAGQTDLAIAALGLLLAVLVVAVLDIRRRQGEMAKRLKQMAERDLRLARNVDRLRSLPANVESSGRRTLDAITGEVQSTVGRLETAGDRVLTGIAQERLAAAERHVELVSHVTGIGTAVTSVADDLTGLKKDLAGTAKLVDNARRGVLAGLEELSQGEKRRLISLREHVDKLGYEPVRQVQALMQLNKRIEARAPLPPTGGWAMEPTTLLRLVQLVDQIRPSVVVECGSGASTVWLAYALESLGSGRLVALEHDERYAEQTRRTLSEHGLSAVVEVRHAPLSDVEVNGETFTWYDPSAVQDLKDIELLLVDGPPRASGPRARYPALPLLGTRLAPGARIVLDDVDRTEEQEAADAWLAETPGLVREGSETDRSALLSYRPG